MFADLDEVLARRGLVVSDDTELWRIAAMLGVHRPTVDDSDLAWLTGTSGAGSGRVYRSPVLDPAIAEMLENDRIYQETGQLPEWGPESPQERANNLRNQFDRRL